ncbi:ComEC family competence protein [Patescibacteria group bacterium]|nr:ComEC family competence protein [Patescibacteria group bacterium]
MAAYKLFRAFLISFLAAPFFADLLKIKNSPLSISKILLTSSIIFLLGVLPIKWPSNKLKQLIFILLGLFLSTNLYVKNLPNSNPDYFKPETIGEYITIDGVVEKISKRPKNTQVTIKTSETKILAFLPFHVELKLYQPVKIQGTLELPKNSGEFDYQKYLKRFNIHYLLYKAELVSSLPSKKISLKKSLSGLKEILEKYISKNIPDPNSSILIGLLTGTRTSLPPEMSENFKKLGLTHILAISGYNITLIVNIINQALSFMARKPRFWLTIIGLVCFTIFVGAEPPVMRACIMGIINLYAIKKGYKPNLLNAILLSAVFMYLADPLIITWDISFQLSFASTLGIIYISPYMQNLLKKVPKNFGLQENLSLTLAAQIATMPITIINFKEFSILAPIANMLILPLIPFCMMAGAASTVVSLILPFIKEFCFLPTNIIISLTIKIVEGLALIPVSTVKL